MAGSPVCDPISPNPFAAAARIAESLWVWNTSVNKGMASLPLEAMAMESPVVLSNIGGAAEMVENGISGLLFDAGDIDALTGLLSKLYDSGRRRREIGVAARERVIRRFRFPDMVAEYERLMFI